MAPSTRYVDSGGVSIAYQVVGEGPFDMVLVPGWISNIEMYWGWPEVATSLKGVPGSWRLLEVAGASAAALPGGPGAAERVVKRGDRLAQRLARHAPGLGRAIFRVSSRRAASPR